MVSTAPIQYLTESQLPRRILPRPFSNYISTSYASFSPNPPLPPHPTLGCTSTFSPPSFYILSLPFLNFLISPIQPLLFPTHIPSHCSRTSVCFLCISVFAFPSTSTISLHFHCLLVNCLHLPFPLITFPLPPDFAPLHPFTHPRHFTNPTRVIFFSIILFRASPSPLLHLSPFFTILF